MNRHDDDDQHGMSQAAHEAAIEDLARLIPAAPSAALRRRIAAALDAPQAPSKPAGTGAWWLAERMLWAGGGAIAAAVPLLLQAPPAPSPESGPAVAVVQPAVESDPAPAADEVSGHDAAAAPIAEESLAWSDDGVHFLDGQVPARVIRHWVLERFPGADGEGLVRPREDVFVVPVALR